VGLSKDSFQAQVNSILSSKFTLWFQLSRIPMRVFVVQEQILLQRRDWNLRTYPNSKTSGSRSKHLEIVRRLFLMNSTVDRDVSLWIDRKK